MFARLDGDGSLVLKLPSERVNVLIGQGVGQRWGVAEGQFLKEYVRIDHRQRARWLTLAKESYAFVATKGRKTPVRTQPRR
jgi:hypothetical protein